MLVTLAAHQTGVEVADALCPAVAQGVTAAVAGAVEHKLADILAVLILVVGLQVLVQLLEGDFLFLLAALLQSGEAVSRHRKAAAVHTHVVEVGAAVGDVHTLVDKAVLEQIEDQLRLALALILQMVHDAAAGGIHRKGQMLFKDGKQPLGGRLSAFHHFVEGHLKHTGQVHLHRVVHGVLHAGDAHPVAACRHSAPCQLLGVAAADEAVHQGIVGGVAGPALLVFKQIANGLAEEVLVHLVVDTDGQIAGDVDLVGCLQRQVGKFGGHVVALGIGAAQLEVAAVLQIHAGQVEHCVFIGESAEGNVTLVVGQQQLVQLTAGAATVVGAGEHGKPAHPLHRIPEGLRLFIGDALVLLRQLPQVFCQLGILLLLGQRLQLTAHAAQEGDDGLHHLNFRIVELVMALVVQGTLLLQFFQDTAPAKVEADLQVGGEVVAVVDAGNDVVAVEEDLQVVEGIGRIPLVLLGAQALHKHEALAHHAVHGVAVQRVGLQQTGVVVCPGLVAVNRAVFVVGLQLEVELVLHDGAVIVLVGAAQASLLLGLADLSGTQQGNALVVAVALVGGVGIHKADFRHFSHLPLQKRCPLPWSGRLPAAHGCRDGRWRTHCPHPGRYIWRCPGD